MTPTRLDTALFLVLVALLGARPLIPENFESLAVTFVGQLAQADGVPPGPTPALTAVLDTLALAAAGVALARRARGGPAVAGFALLIVGLLVSTRAAGDRQMAALAGSSFVIGLLTLAALAALPRPPGAQRILIAVILATGSLTAVKCVQQVTHELAETRAFWEQERKPALLRQGLAADDPLIVNYERRLLSGEAYGFLSHPNITGTVVATCGVLAAGLALALARRGRSASTRRRGRVPAAMLAAAAVAALAAAATKMTGSLGAGAAGAAGLGLLAVLLALRRRLASHAALTAVVGLGAYFGSIALVAGLGAARGTLPHPSLAFRWYYWSAAVRAWQDVPLTGLGRGNFAAAYMRHKAPESTEEVRDPHNLWVSLLVELGPAALGGVMLLLAVWLVRVLRATADGPTSAGPPEGAVARNAVFAAAGVLGLQGLATGAAPLPLLWAVDVAAPWLVALGLGLWLTGHVVEPADAAAVRCAALAASLAGGIHALIDFTPLTAGGLAYLVLLAAAALGPPPGRSETPGRTEAPGRPGTRRRLVAGWAVAAAAVAAHTALVLRPVVLSTAAAERLEALVQTLLRTGRPPTPDVVLAAAGPAGQWDPVLAAATARVLLTAARVPGLPAETCEALLAAAAEWAARAAALNPHDTNHAALAGTIADHRATLAERRQDAAAWRTQLLAATDWWVRATELYPTNPRAHLSAARAWVARWRLTGEAEAASAARRHLDAALSIDATRKPDEVVRLRAEERRTIAALRAEIDAR